MDIYFNEKCLENCVDIDLTISFLHHNLSVLSNTKARAYTHFSGLQSWRNILDGDFDAPSRRYFVEIVQLLEDCQDISPQFYYYYIGHQDYILSISDNIFPSSLVLAAEKILSQQVTAILNLPGSLFNKRSHVPILKSPHDSKIKDELANIPCFDDALKIKQFVLLYEKIKPHVEKTEFENFSKEYHTFLDSFSFANWEPKKIGEDGKLVAESAFPMSKNKFIADKISAWRIKKEAIGANIAQLKQLGGLVLEMHGYIKNAPLTSHYKYEIYEAGYGNNKLLVSLDVENGLFEVIERSGTHIGVYNYVGAYQSHYIDQEKLQSHSLMDIPEHMFIFK